MHTYMNISSNNRIKYNIFIFNEYMLITLEMGKKREQRRVLITPQPTWWLTDQTQHAGSIVAFKSPLNRVLPSPLLL